MHKGIAYPGEHQAIVDRPLWDEVHAILKESPRQRAGTHRGRTPALLKGLLFGPDGAAMTPTFTRRRGRLYRYYVSNRILRRGAEPDASIRLPAAEIERAVVGQIRTLLRAPEIIVRTWRKAKQTVVDLTEADVRDALLRFDTLWDELFPAEQARLVRLLVDRIDIGAAGAEIHLRTDGLTGLLGELDIRASAEAAE